MRKMHLIWHMRDSLIFAYVAQSHGGRELVECGAHPLSPHVIVPHGANMRGTLICHMRCIFLFLYIYIYFYIYIYIFFFIFFLYFFIYIYLYIFIFIYFYIFFFYTFLDHCYIYTRY